MAQAVTQKIIPLEQETRTHTNTAAAAHYLMRQQQTLRLWNCENSRGPIKPICISGRLAWPVSEIKRVLGVAS